MDLATKIIHWPNFVPRVLQNDSKTKLRDVTGFYNHSTIMISVLNIYLTFQVRSLATILRLAELPCIRITKVQSVGKPYCVLVQRQARIAEKSNLAIFDKQYITVGDDLLFTITFFSKSQMEGTSSGCPHCILWSGIHQSSVTAQSFAAPNGLACVYQQSGYILMKINGHKQLKVQFIPLLIKVWILTGYQLVIYIHSEDHLNLRGQRSECMTGSSECAGWTPVLEMERRTWIFEMQQQLTSSVTLKVLRCFSISVDLQKHLIIIVRSGAKHSFS